ncbi:MAG TPA: cytidine deaminase [Fimbriimonas sp.]|nr:cytidine deaminase [Fimbriimonas sp.]
MSESELVQAAWEVKDRAYCPYSGYPVGAAVLDELGSIYTGCNVENVSFPAGICAERSAIVKMVSERGRKIKAVAVATADGGLPCGICLQVMLEFADSPSDVSILASSAPGTWQRFTLMDLLPHGFRSELPVRETRQNKTSTEPPMRA